MYLYIILNNWLGGGGVRALVGLREGLDQKLAGGLEDCRHGTGLKLHSFFCKENKLFDISLTFLIQIQFEWVG